MFRDLGDPPRAPALIEARARLLAVIAVAFFAVIGFRLWSLQVLHGASYRAVADAQRVREVVVRAPRGQIVDRNGRPLVVTKPSTSVAVNPRKLPPPGPARDALFRRLGRMLGTTPHALRVRIVHALRRDRYAQPSMADDARSNQIAYLLERAPRFPGVTLVRSFVRTYPNGQVGAQLFGTIGEVTSRELREPRYAGVKLGDRVGQSGIEAAYDEQLRGRDGATQVEVDARGRSVGRLRTVPPVPGGTLRLSIDLSVERMGQQVLAGRRGAFVVMDVHSGELLGLGSAPTFDPSVFTRPVTPSELRALASPDRGSPLTDRATQGLYPTGSTFKPITATAALEGGLITPDSSIFDGGSLQVGGISFSNAGGVAHGSIALRQALTVSSDVFFYTLGLEANSAGNGLLIQRWARRLGLGRPTGLEIPAGLPGLIPSPEWRDRLFRRHLTDRPWSAGDNVNLAVGQGDVQVTPLQLARAYAAIANGGYLVTPHLALRGSKRRRRVGIQDQYRQAILEGLRGAASAPGGTSTDVFKGFPIPVAGKTGTAQKGAGRPDQSWYVALAPYPNPRYVVAVTDETGGWGAQTAAPDARRIIAALYGLRGKAAAAVKGTSHTF